MRRLLVLALVIAGSAQAETTRLTEAAVRAFVAREEAAWNRRDAHAFAASLTPDAVFIDRARDNQNRLVENGRSTRPQAVAQARRFFAGHRFHENTEIKTIVIAPDGRSAQVFAREVSHIETPGRPDRTLCAETEQLVVLVRGRILSKGQTDTDIRCPR